MNLDEIVNICIEEAKKCLEHDDVPIGAVIVKDNVIIAKAHNTRQCTNNILGHAEISAIIEAEKALKSWNLADCTLYVTLKPCSMCLEVIKQARIDKVFYLLDKNSAKKEYNKTKFLKLDSENSEQKYARMLSSFFKKMR